MEIVLVKNASVSSMNQCFCNFEFLIYEVKLPEVMISVGMKFVTC